METATASKKMLQTDFTPPHTVTTLTYMTTTPTNQTTNTNTERDTMTTTNQAEQYAETIAAEVRALEAVLSGDYTDTTDEDRDNMTPAERIAADDALEVAEAMAEQAGEELGDYIAAPSVSDYLNAYCLEFVAIGENDGHGWNVTGAKATRTFGGPNCWIVWDDTNYLKVEAYWGGDNYTASVYAPVVAEAFAEFADVVPA